MDTANFNIRDEHRSGNRLQRINPVNRVGSPFSRRIGYLHFTARLASIERSDPFNTNLNKSVDT